ncbi:Rossmann-like and DUF2520 domain-containing protein [Flavobacterium sp.]|uniref:Rossmann-like and DUF2520 domain-containing protein n=1 Tax=Flavobacterium sp. TaxID=239 RepID=UPI003D6B558F
MISVVLIGSGNVANHLISAFAKSDSVDVIQVFARNPETVSQHIDTAKIISSYSEIAVADLYIVSVSDNAVTEVSQNLPFSNKLVVHTSGTVAMTDLNSENRRGVFYPLQTFSKSKEVDFKGIPFCLETEDESDYKLLEKVAKSISDKVFNIHSEQRKALHVAAVFVNNFVNHLYQIGDTICIENNIPFEILYPLIRETAAKINSLSPKEAQTGPAVRNDTQTINTHLSFLSDSTQKEIYKILTKSIIDNGKKL